MRDLPIFKRILFIGPNCQDHRGGIGAVLSIYQKNIADFNFIATYDGNLSGIGNLLLFLRSLFRLFSKLLISRGIRIVHIHGSSKGSFYRKYIVFLMAKYIFRKRIIYHVHSGKFHLFCQSSSKFLQKLIYHLLIQSDHIFCLSQHWQTFLISSFPIKSISIANNPIEVPTTFLQKSNQNNYLSLLFLGKIGNNKGIFDLLDVLAENRRQFNNKIRLKIGGDGQVERLKKYINANQLEDLVEYTGWVGGHLKHHLLAECDVLILPSYSEGLPIAILEAMSYGKAIVSTMVGSIPEVVKDGKNGYLIEPGDKAALAKVLTDLLKYPELMISMGSKSKEEVVEFYPIKVLPKLIRVYENIISDERFF